MQLFGGPAQGRKGGRTQLSLHPGLPAAGLAAATATLDSEEAGVTEEPQLQEEEEEEEQASAGAAPTLADTDNASRVGNTGVTMLRCKGKVALQQLVEALEADAADANDDLLDYRRLLLDNAVRRWG